MEHDPVSSLNYLQQLQVEYWRASAITGAIELQVFTKLSGKKLSAKELAEACSIKIRQVEDYFNFLVSVNLLDRDEHNHYSNTFTSDTYLNRHNPNTYFGTNFAFHVKMPRWAAVAENL